MAFRDAVVRELRVAFSPRAQPVWFRVIKWSLIVWAFVRFRGAPYFWWGLAIAFGLALGIHFLWRAKTKQWTQPWGGWNDVEAARRKSGSP